MIGSRLGPYEVTAKLGEGGMGVVYRALDSRLGRDVAVKVLPEGLTADPDRLARFEREAKLLAQLNHPHIAQVYGFEVSGEIRALIMELVEGPTLAEALESGPLPPDEALEIALQIAEALDAAHQKGIVHRDLKPHNIKMAMDGAFKVLDFGLAKALEPEAGTPSRVAMSPTLTAGATAHGMILGTAAYMAPEQAKGGAVDKRADIWAFGVVLYEMLSGRRLFLGDSVPETLAGVLKGEIDLDALPPGTPAALTRLLRRCIARDPQRRMRDAGDVRLELEEIRNAGPAAVTAVSPNGRASRLVQVGALFAAVALGAASIALWSGRSDGSVAASPEVRFHVPPPSGAVFSSDLSNLALAISPDGATLAFVALEGADSRIWVRRIDSLEARPLAGTEGARSLTWSPDGRSIAFFAGEKLKRLGLDGGTAVPICDVPPWVGYGASWGAADEILISTGLGQSIQRVAATGGPLETLLQPDPARNEVRVSWPRYFADGRGFLYLSRDGNYLSTLMQFEPGQAPRAVARMDSRFELIEPDLLVFSRDGALLAQRFDRTAGRLVGPPISIAPAVRFFLSTSTASFAASPAGTLFYLSAQTSSRLLWVDRAGRVGGSVGPAGDYWRLTLSRDGSSILTDRLQPELGTLDLWQMDVARGAEGRITSGSQANFAGLWLGDGKSIVYSALSARGWSPHLVRRTLGTGQEERLLPRNAFQQATDVTRDGRMLAFVERSEAGNFRAWTLQLDGEQRAEQLFQTKAQEGQVRFSPEGTHVAYLSDESGSQTAYLSPLSSPGVKTRLFPGAVRILRWRADGREILLLTPEGELLAVPVGPPPQLEPGRPSILFTLPPGEFWRDFDVAPDGSRFLAIVRQRHGEAEPGTVILNWRPDAVP